MALFDILNVNPAQSVQQSVAPASLQQGLFGLMQQLGQGAGRSFRAATGEDVRTPEQKMNVAIQGLTNLDDPAQLRAFARRLVDIGETQRALVVTQLATEAEKAQAQAQNAQSYRENIVSRFRTLGNTEAAESALVANESQLEDLTASLEEQEKERRVQQQEEMVIRNGRSARVAMLNQSGIPRDQWNDLLSVPSSDFVAVINGQKADPVMYSTPSGTIVPYNTNQYGQIWDESQRKFVTPSSLGLSVAPQMQWVVNKADPLTALLDSPAGETFTELTENAREATTTISTANRSLDLLNQGVNTGTFSAPSTALGNLASALGMDNAFTQDAARTQEFIATRAGEVARYIQAFGSGTGLSDADREFAKIGAGADPATQAQALRNLIRIQIQVANEIRAQQQNIYNRLASDPSVDKTFLSIYSLPSPTEATVLSERALNYLNP